MFFFFSSSPYPHTHDASSILISTRYPRECIERHQTLANVSACLTIHLYPVYTHVTRCTAAWSILYIVDCMRTIRFCLLVLLSIFFFSPSRNPNILSSLIGLFSLPAFPTSSSCIFSHPNFHALMQSLFSLLVRTCLVVLQAIQVFFNLCIIFIGDIYITLSYLGSSVGIF